jgi:hypothetical protein
MTQKDQYLQTFMVFGGNDSFGNKFYVCQVVVMDKNIIPGHLFQSICCVVLNGKEVAFKEFQVLTSSKSNDYEWVLMLSKAKRLPLNSVIGGESIRLGNKEINYIGRCYVNHFGYRATVIGKI